MEAAQEAAKARDAAKAKAKAAQEAQASAEATAQRSAEVAWRHSLFHSKKGLDRGGHPAPFLHSSLDINTFSHLLPITIDTFNIVELERHRHGRGSMKALEAAKAKAKSAQEAQVSAEKTAQRSAEEAWRHLRTHYPATQTQKSPVN